MKRLVLALAIVAMAAACSKAEQQGQAADTAQMSDTSKMMSDTSHMMAGDTAKRM